MATVIGTSEGPIGVVGVQRVETERMIQRGRIGALLLAGGLVLSFGNDRSPELTLAVALLLVTVLVVELVLRRPRRQRTITWVGWASFASDVVVCAAALAGLTDDPVDPVSAIAFIIGIEAAARWGGRGAVGGGLAAGGLAITWAAAAYDAVGRDLPATSIAFRGLSVVVMALPVGLLVDRLRRQRELTGRIFERSSEAIALVGRNGRIVSANPAAAALVGATLDELIGEPFAHRLGPALEVEDLEMLRDRSDSGQPVPVPVTDAAGGRRWLAIEADPDDDLELTIVTARDITAERVRGEALAYQASHDALTGLPNRAALRARLRGRLAEGPGAGIVFLDLDGFKEVNDTHGHLAGDTVLIEVADRLRQVTRATDAAYRWAGDEFCLVIDPVEATTLQSIAERIERSFLHGFDLDGAVVYLRASVGLATARTGETEESLIRRADARMYEAKMQSRRAATGPSEEE